MTSDTFKGFSIPSIIYIAILENITAFNLVILTPLDIKVIISIIDK